MKKIILIGLIGLGLQGCGGGGDSEFVGDDGSNGSGSAVKTMGLYTGTTNQGQSAIGLVDKNNKFWFLYSPPYSNGISGFITGNLTVSGNNIKAANGKDFNFGGSAVYNTTINGVVEEKKSLKGAIAYTPSNQVTFDTLYDVKKSEVVASISAISGNYRGESAIVQGVEDANLTITNTGVVSGRGQSGCSFSGKVTAEKNTPYYNINLVFGYSPCFMAGQEVKGVAYYDSADKTLFAVAENGSRQDAVLFLGSKF